LFVVTNLFINGGRTGQLAFVISIFVLSLLHIKNRLKVFLIILSLISSIAYMGYTFSPNFKTRIDQSVQTIKSLSENKQQKYCSSFGARVGAWIVSYELIKQKPILGIGVCDTMSKFKSQINSYHEDKKCILFFPNLHNDFIHIFVQLGAVGALIYILLFYFIATIKPTDNTYRYMPLTFVSVYLISSMFENMIHQQFSMAIFALFVGLFTSMEKSK
jgi:O-antigen ligase